jgi:hypothetical protein
MLHHAWLYTYSNAIAREEERGNSYSAGMDDSIGAEIFFFKASDVDAMLSIMLPHWRLWVASSPQHREVEEIAMPIPPPRSPTSLLGLTESGKRIRQRQNLTEAEADHVVLVVLSKSTYAL